MKFADPLLNEAFILLQQRRFHDVLTKLEGNVFNYKNNLHYYNLVAKASLEINDLDRAEAYYYKIYASEERNVDTLLSLAILHAQKGNRSEALKLWLEVMDLDSSNKYAKRGLNMLRKEDNHLPFVLGLDQKKKLQAPIPRYVDRQKVLSVTAIVAFTLGLTGLGYWWYLDKTKVVEAPVVVEDAPSRVLPVLSLNDQKNLVTFDGEFPVTLNGNAIQVLYEEVNKRFLDGEDNQAQRMINELMLSNASVLIKQRVLAIEPRLETEPTWPEHPSFGYAQVEKFPALYDNTFVMWTGAIGNLVLNKETQTLEFNLLVGYERQKVLEGVVPVEVNFVVDIKEDLPIRVWGQLQLVGDVDRNDVKEFAKQRQFKLNALSIQQFIIED